MNSAIAPLLTILIAHPVIFTLLDYLTPIYMPPSQMQSPRNAEDVLLSKMEAGLLPPWVQIKVEGTTPPDPPLQRNSIRQDVSLSF
jgi:hypothetical protein